MKSQPLVSVIVPVYNAEFFLEKCLNSLINQSYQNLEFVLINDGSLDNSFSICEQYGLKDKRFKLLNIKNKGVANARNLGISNCNGDYICFVDPDDFIDPEYIFSLQEKIEDNTLVLQDINRIYKGNVTKKVFNYEDQEYDLSNGLLNFFLSNSYFVQGFLWNKIFIRDIIVKNNLSFDTKMLVYEDEIFYYNYLKY